MDSLTQIVLGAAVGEAVLGKKVGNKAMLYGAIAGTIPDLDAFAGLFTDTITAIEIHRGFTHSIFFAVVVAPIFGWLISKIEKKSAVRWKNWSWLMFWGLFTHPLLDAHTTWGTQLFWPFDLRLAYKNIFVIDPLYTLPFLVFLILVMRQKKTSGKRRKYNNLGLIISSTYLLLITPALKLYTFSEFQKALKNENINYKRIETRPAAFNTILWTANVETNNQYLIANYSLFDSKPIQFQAYAKNHKLVEKWKDKKNLQRLIDIANNWYIISQKNDNLYFNDLRFGKMNFEDSADAFVFSYKLEEINQSIIATEVEKDPEAAKQFLPDLWNRIWGN